MWRRRTVEIVFFFNDTATTEIYTLSLHDALPISTRTGIRSRPFRVSRYSWVAGSLREGRCSSTPRSTSVSRRSLRMFRSEEHTSELQSRQYLGCRLLLVKKKTESCRGLATACSLL